MSNVSQLVEDPEIYSHLENILVKLAKVAGLQNIDLLTQALHVWPDFHGNRSPLSDSTLRGMISGLTLSSDDSDWAILYLATIQALAVSNWK